MCVAVRIEHHRGRVVDVALSAPAPTRVVGAGMARHRHDHHHSPGDIQSLIKFGYAGVDFSGPVEGVEKKLACVLQIGLVLLFGVRLRSPAGSMLSLRTICSTTLKAQLLLLICFFCGHLNWSCLKDEGGGRVNPVNLLGAQCRASRRQWGVLL